MKFLGSALVAENYAHAGVLDCIADCIAGCVADEARPAKRDRNALSRQPHLITWRRVRALAATVREATPSGVPDRHIAYP
jgi:hypothetical protein